MIFPMLFNELSIYFLLMTPVSFIHIQTLKGYNLYLNSSPIDECGESACKGCCKNA